MCRSRGHSHPGHSQAAGKEDGASDEVVGLDLAGAGQKSVSLAVGGEKGNAQGGNAEAEFPVFHRPVDVHGHRISLGIKEPDGSGGGLGGVGIAEDQGGGGSLAVAKLGTIETPLAEAGGRDWKGGKLSGAEANGQARDGNL